MNSPRNSTFVFLELKITVEWLANGVRLRFLNTLKNNVEEN